MEKSKTERKLTDEEIEIKNKYKVLFNTPVGREVLKDLAKRCYVDKAYYRPGEPIEIMIQRDGQRMVILKILKMCDIDICNLIQKI